MQRRSFLRALAGLPFLPAALSALPMPIVIHQRKMMARVRITQELMDDWELQQRKFYTGRQWLKWNGASETWEAALTHETRRLILDLTPPERRFVDSDGVVVLA